MDSFYITATAPNPDKDNLMALINCCIRHRYDFKGLFTNYGTYQPYFPTLVVNQEDIPHINELKESTQPISTFIFLATKAYLQETNTILLSKTGLNIIPF